MKKHFCNYQKNVQFIPYYPHYLAGIDLDHPCYRLYKYYKLW